MPKNGADAIDERTRRRTNAPLARVSVNLTAKATRALDDTVEMTGDSQTDIINRAIQVYAHLERILNAGGSVLTQAPDQKDPVSLQFF
ncbi:hypothetical protein AB0C27_53995 [Nonomuraea sp. NPDC048882]|uniref:hypothetical protein n=1 Tax=Nonomuraea sp. NPDC048882 TaxID=3154347 RepID=UPI0034043B4C